MSRMRLCLDSPLLPEGTVYDDPQPIYDFDFEQAVADGLSLSGANLNKILADNDNVSMCRFEISGVTLNQYLSTNMPRRPWDEGDVLRSRISPYIQDENDVYQPDPQYYNFQLVSETSDPQPAPDDWGDASNYFGRSLETVSGHTYERFYNVRKSEDWTAGSITYYKDVGRNAIKQYYTAAGYSFSVYRGGQGKSSTQIGPLRVSIGSDSMSSTQGTASAKGYNFTNPTDGALQYYSTTTDQGGSGSKQSVSGYYWASNNWSSANQVKVLEGTDPSMNGVNTTLVFISFRYEDPDPDHYQPDIWYYGIAMIDHNNWTERAIPTNISVIAFTSAFWGNSIINGGGGESVWGNDGPPAAPQGGNGSWSAPSNNRGDGTGNDIDTEVNRYNSDFSAAYGGYHMYKMTPANSAPLTEFEGQLWDPSIWNSWENHAQNPLAAIITCHAVPENLSPATQSTDVIKAAGATLSTTAAPTFDRPMFHYHVGTIDINKYTDSFADYTATNIFIHLPYVGVYQIDTEAVMEGQLSVDYIVDSFTADITARVWTKDREGNCNYRYEFKGNCGKILPIAQIIGAGAQRLGAIGSTLINAIGLEAGNIASFASNFKGVRSSAPELTFGESIAATKWAVSEEGGLKPISLGSTITTGIHKALTASALITTSNASGGTVSSLVDDQCFLIISRPQWSAPENYRKLFGYPSDISGTIEDNFHGFLSVRSIRLEGIPATPQEKSEIEELMKAGVYVDDNFGPEEE